jgi:hypothetical protein
MLLCRGLSRREGTREGACSLVGDDGNYSFKHPPPLADSETSGLQIIHKIPEVLKTLNRYETEKKTARIGNPIFQSSWNIEAMCNSKTVWQQSLSTSGTTSNPNIFEILGAWS